MKLEGQSVFVAGGAGNVGEGLVRAFMREGAAVIVPSRSPEKLNALKEYVSTIKTGELITYAGSISNASDTETLRAFVKSRTRGGLDIAVASLGGWTQGFPIHETPFNVWTRVLEDNLTSHFLAIKTLVPLLKKDGTYVHINGFSADEPYPMAGAVAMSAAAQKSLVMTLAKELEPAGIRVYEFILGPVLTRQRLRFSGGRPEWFSPEEIGQEIISRIGEVNQNDVVHYLLNKQQN